jgi:hypothetical protein
MQSITLSFFLTTPYSSGNGTRLATPTRGVVEQIGPTPTRVGSRYSSSTRVVYMFDTERIQNKLYRKKFIV